MTMYMYKVYYTEDGKTRTALFETEKAAISFYDHLVILGITAVINKWQWRTEVEE